MAENENNKGLLGVIQGAADSVVKAVQGIKLPEINIPNPFQGNTEKQEKPPVSGEITSVPVKSAIQIIYYMMAADGAIFHNEEVKFDEIGKELDPAFDSYKADIIQECRAQINQQTDPADPLEALRTGVENAVSAGVSPKEAAITPKVLVWDLLTVAYSDGDYDERERQILKCAADKLNIADDVLLEMESSFLTLRDLENETAWIKTTDRQYLTIEQMVNEIADRKTAIMESIKDLITL